MNIVEIKHTEDQEKTYWFAVPEKLVPYLKKGDWVLCDTRKGKQYGVAQTGVLSGDGIERLAITNGARFPLRQVCAVRMNYPTAQIKIENGMKATRPGKKKIIARLNEYYEHGAFNTVLIVDSNHCLKDGYTAYLVAKMFDLPEIPVMIWA